MKTEFELYHAANPHIYAGFAAIALAWGDVGKKRISARAIFHTMRETHGAINDKFSPYYARMFLSEYPAYSNKIELRRALADYEGCDVRQIDWTNLLTQE